MSNHARWLMEEEKNEDSAVLVKEDSLAVILEDETQEEEETKVSEEVEIVTEFEGADSVSKIPKGKEKEYGI